MKLLFCIPIVALVTSVGPAAFAQDNQKHAAEKPVTVNLKNAEGQSVGTAVLSEAPHGVSIKLDITKLPPGEHSMHIHQIAKCDPPDFKSAGPHFDHGEAGHSEHVHGAMAAGDIPNFSLIVAKDGTAHVKVIAPNVTMENGDHSVFSNGGTAIVIHAVSGGTGDAAPARIACGVITRGE
jgi:Cu-Zn family superoxide dismutase